MAHQDLIDVMPFQYTITESAGGRLRVEGVFQRSDVENRNGRIYPKSLWEKVLNDKAISESLQNRAMFGELDHPEDGKTKLARVSHVITNLSLQPDGVVTGVAEVLEDTPNGRILKALFESNTQVGISSRGSGSVNGKTVAEDFKLSTFDFVARPSTPGALPTPQSSRSYREDNFTVDTTVEHSFEDPEYDAFIAELDGKGIHLMESDDDVETLGFNVLSTYSWLKENISRLTHDEILEVSDVLGELAARVFSTMELSPENASILEDLDSKISASYGMLFTGTYEPNNI